MAGGPILRGPGPVQNGLGQGQGRGARQNSLQAGPQLRHRLHQPGPQAKTGHLRYPWQGKGYLILLRRFLREHGGDHNNIAEMVCDISPAFLVAIGGSLPGANITVD
ncbi:hypothetical protein DFAR_940001 [Desulfarculales bacterium]